MTQLIASAFLILAYLGVISLGCLVAGVTALFDGSPLWFGVGGILLGALGLFCTHHHLMVAVNAYKHIKALEEEDPPA